MARILAYTSPARGHIYPLVAILKELQSRGHQVAMRTLAAEVSQMQTLGFECEAIDSRIEAMAHADWQQTNVRAALKNTVDIFV